MLPVALLTLTGCDRGEVITVEYTDADDGAGGTINLNHLLQKELNRQPGDKKVPGHPFKSGDKVMHLRNNYQKDVYNGDIGIIESIDNEKTELTVNYYGRSVHYDFDELDEITVALKALGFAKG